MTAAPDSSEDFSPAALDLRVMYAQRIARFGFTNVCVGYGVCMVPGCACGPSRNPYAYSLGLHRLGHPEVVSMRLAMNEINDLVTFVHDAAANGKPLAIGREHRHRVGDDVFHRARPRARALDLV